MCRASWQGVIEPYITEVTLLLSDWLHLQMVRMLSWRPRPGKRYHIQFLNGLSLFGFENDRIATNMFCNSKTNKAERLCFLIKDEWR